MIFNYLLMLELFQWANFLMPNSVASLLKDNPKNNLKLMKNFSNIYNKFPIILIES